MTYVITKILNRDKIPNGAEIIRARCTAVANKEGVFGPVEYDNADLERSIIVFARKDGEQMGGEYLTDDDDDGLVCSLGEYHERLDAWRADS
jgi:hypothetical protein